MHSLKLTSAFWSVQMWLTAITPQQQQQVLAVKFIVIISRWYSMTTLPTSWSDVFSWILSFNCRFTTCSLCISCDESVCALKIALECTLNVKCMCASLSTYNLCTLPKIELHERHESVEERKQIEERTHRINATNKCTLNLIEISFPQFFLFCFVNDRNATQMPSSSAMCEWLSNYMDE